MSTKPLLPKVTKLSAQAIWKEVQHLNPWLAGDEGRQALAELLPPRFHLMEATHQQVAGDLFVDVLGTTASGEKVVVEAQLGASNHDHLGKLITYAAIYQAGAAVWIVGDARPEHQQALNSLNQEGMPEFFLVKVEAVRVENSPPAPLLTLITGPTLEIKTAGKVKAAMKERERQRLAFWEAFLPDAASIDPRFAAKKPRPTTRMGVGTGKLGVRWVVGLLQHASSLELVVVPGVRGKFGDTAPVMAELEQSKAAIETALQGLPLEWVNGIRPRLRIAIDKGGWGDPGSWPAVRADAITKLRALVDATGPVIKGLKSRPAAPQLGAVSEEAEEEEADEE